MLSSFICAKLKGQISLVLFLFLIVVTTLVAKPALVMARPADPLKCMALNVYFEARGEPYIGKIAVGMVTLNRASSRYFSNSVCGVVYQRSQFSWTIDKYSDTPRKGKIWDDSVEVAKTILARAEPDPTGQASHYYNPSAANPAWARKFKRTAIIGRHHFHQMPGFVKSTRGKSTKTGFDPMVVEGQFFEVNANGKLIDPEGLGADKEVVHPFRDYNEFLNFIDELPDAATTEDNGTSPATSDQVKMEESTAPTAEPRVISL